MLGPYFKVMDLIVYLGLEIARLNLKFELGLPNKTSIQLVQYSTKGQQFIVVWSVSFYLLSLYLLYVIQVQ